MTVIKIRCNGPGRHANDVDLEKSLGREVILRGPKSGTNPSTSPNIPERIVLQCRECADGKVILTRKVIEENLGR